VARCNSCGAEIVWAKTLNGKRAPLEPGGGGWVIRSGYMSLATPGDTGPFYEPHFAHCPQAKQWRRAR